MSPQLPRPSLAERTDRPPRIVSWSLLLTLALALGSSPGCNLFRSRDELPADAVIYARVITMEPSRPRAKGLAIRNGIIVKVGNPQALKPLVGSDTRIFNWTRWTVVPGFIDSHVDLLGLGQAMVGLDLYDATGMEEISSRVRASLAERGVGDERWIVGYGWEEHRFRDFKPLDRALLDDVASRRPVLLHRADRRAALANGAALTLAGLGPKSPDPPGGKLGRREDGSLNGVLLGNAVRLVANMVPPPPLEVRRELLKAALRRLVEAGFTSVHDLGGDAETYKVLYEMGRAGLLPLRVYSTIDIHDPGLQELLAKGPQIDLFDHYLTLRAVRVDLDGDLGSRAAHLKQPYEDAPTWTGLQIHERGHLLEYARTLYDSGFQLIVIGHGDAAVATTLDVLERLLPDWKHWNQVRPRLDGIDVIDLEDAPRFGMTNLIANCQPSRVSRQLYWLVDRLGEERLSVAHPWRALEQGGAVVAYGSGAPELKADPRRGFISAVNRQDETGWPPGGWKPVQRLTAPEALRAFTLNAAYSGFEERIKGSIRPGKLADLTIVSRDLLYTDPEDLETIRIIGALVGGRIRYRTRHLR